MLISIIGDVGSGKTLLSTAIAVLDERPIFSNYKIHIARWQMLHPETLLKMPFGSVAILDEAYTWIESRLSGSNAINRYASYILMQSRKRGIDIILTDQLSRMIDVRFREMTNVEIHCEATIQGFEYHVLRLSAYHYFKPRTFIIPYEIAELIFPFYDSWEKVDPIDSDLIFKVTKDKTDLVKEIDKHAQKILKTVPYAAITKGIVSDYCLRNAVSKGLVDHIFNAIRASRFKG